MDKGFVLITGVSTGIGYDAVRYLIDMGYYVFGSVRKQKDHVRLSTDFPNNFTCLKFDVTKTDEVIAAFDVVKNKVGSDGLSGLVNNAGLALGGPIELMDDDKFC